MAEISVNLLASNVPVNGLTDVPEITIQRLDTGAEVVADTAMTDRTTRGLYSFTFAHDPLLDYAFLIDADPLAAGQVDVRYWRGSFDGMLEQARDLAEADESYDSTLQEYHKFRRGTAVDLIPVKDVSNAQVTLDTSLVQP